MKKIINKFLFLKRRAGLHILTLVAMTILAGFFFFLKTEMGKAQDLLEKPENFPEFSIVQENSFLPVADPFEPEGIEIVQQFEVVVTGYSSTPCQTWGNPFITASGSWVEDGIIANNLLPFGTKVRLPELYGNKIFVVKDRMNSRKKDYNMDIWFSSTQAALNFGINKTYVEVIEETEA
ncbi:3D domain-containing protein [Candidatus Parcubacteria bacterium]|nr:3D domain-containing protein [Candidatus Parcubacteria bacterium]